MIPIAVCHTWPGCHENPGARGPDLVLTTHQFPSCSPGNFPEDGASSESSAGAAGGGLHSSSIRSIKSLFFSVHQEFIKMNAIFPIHKIIFLFFSPLWL